MAPILSRVGSDFGFGKKTAAAAAVPISATGGTTTAAGITPGNGYRYHVFTSPGTFTVSNGSGPIEYLVIAGGGSGGYDRAGGAGAGGMRSNSPGMPSPRRGASYTASPGTYTVTVGSGGAGQTGYPPPNSPGSNSEFYPPSISYPSPLFVRCIGGGSGSAISVDGGGSGGGGGSQAGSPAPPGGAGGNNFAPATDPNHPASQGFPGGGWPSGGAGPINASGGGGAGGAGSLGSPDSSPGGPGGVGLANPDFAAPLISPEIPAPVRTSWSTAVGPTGLYAGGGGGGGHQPEGGFPGLAAGGTGGPGGGGAGGTGPAGAGGNGVNFTGSGGGGGNNLPQGPGGTGGTGIVIIRYLA